MKDDKTNPSDRERVQRALLKKALGYTVEEAVEEYASDGEELRLIKRKVSTRHLPPELTAAKEILSQRERGAAELSDEELLTTCRALIAEVFGKAPKARPAPARTAGRRGRKAEDGGEEARPGQPEASEDGEPAEKEPEKKAAGTSKQEMERRDQHEDQVVPGQNGM